MIIDVAVVDSGDGISHRLHGPSVREANRAAATNTTFHHLILLSVVFPYFWIKQMNKRRDHVERHC